jgi:hypothetical protein
MATMPLGQSHEAPEPQTQTQPQINDPLKLVSRRPSAMDSDKVLHFLSAFLPFLLLLSFYPFYPSASLECFCPFGSSLIQLGAFLLRLILCDLEVSPLPCLV